MLQLDKIQGGLVDEEIEKIEDYLFMLFKPKKYSGSNGLEVKAVNAFEDMCFIIGKEMPRDPRLVTTLTFYRTLENIKKQNAPLKKK